MNAHVAAVVPGLTVSVNAVRAWLLARAAESLELGGIGRLLDDAEESEDLA